MEVKYQEQPRQGGQNQPVQVIQIEDEIEFLVNNIEFILEPQNVKPNPILNRNRLSGLTCTTD